MPGRSRSLPAQSVRRGDRRRAETLPEAVSALLLQRFPLGWSHYVTLLSVPNPDARRFYEIEAADNGWSVGQLKRQLDSSLYERLALSRDKHEVRRLAREGQVVEKWRRGSGGLDGRYQMTTLKYF